MTEASSHQPAGVPCGCSACSTSPASAAPGATLSRRGFLRSASLGVLSFAALGAGKPEAAHAQNPLSPKAAMQGLLEGNARFAARRLRSFDEDLSILRRNTVAKQEPFAAVLSCADSRVPVELIFDQSIGHVFATRVAGNIATPEIVASLEYAAEVLGTPAILVLGHSGCGAVAAAMSGKSVPGQISALYAPIRPAVDEANGDLEAAIKANARIQAGLLASASPLLAGRIKAGKLEVAAGYYALSTGKVSILGRARGASRAGRRAGTVRGDVTGG